METIPVDELKGWFSSMITVLGALDDPRSKVSSISYVRDQLRNPHKKKDQLRKSSEEAYVPKVVSIGPLHRETSRELLYMEETKWRCMRSLLLRTEDELKSFKKCGEAILRLDGVVRACYTGDTKLNSSELAKIMLLDGCFLLELLIRKVKKLDERFRNPKEVEKSPRAEVGNMELVLSDLKLLENQIPLFILTKLFETLFLDKVEGLDYQGFQKIVNNSALSFFGCIPEDKSTPEVGSPKAKETDGCAHFLDLIHMFMTGKEENNDQRSINSTGSGSTESRPEDKSRPENDRPKAEETDDHHSININSSGSTESKQTLQLKRCMKFLFGCSSKSRPEGDSPNGSGSTESKQSLQLKHCAARLEAAGVKIVALEKKGNMSRLENTKFEDTEEKKLVIQQLRITETEEVQWWNLIAWEQNRTAHKKFLNGPENQTRCRFSQYALLFKDLVCCEHDIQLLKNGGVLKVEDGEKRSNKEVMTLFQNMAKGIDVDLSGDESYRQLLEGLNKCSGTKWNRKILSHHWESFKAKTRYTCRELFEIFKRDHAPTVWKTLGVIAAIILLGLTIAQTIFAAISL